MAIIIHTKSAMTIVCELNSKSLDINSILSAMPDMPWAPNVRFIQVKNIGGIVYIARHIPIRKRWGGVTPG
ncbi:MAG: hypothetical protein NC933_04770, partial [Candidatus Omnitrophica bacterium]|nr:hypothetical protein [Candidatus Omnitrophota bacterium]